MDTNRSDHSSIDEPNPKRPKIETEPSTSSKSKINDDCPILNLPADILAKIIAYVPIAQWPSLELLYDFREATLIAWRQLRNVNLKQEFLINRSSLGAGIVSILHKLVEHSPFLTSISGIEFQMDDTFRLLARFKHLQSITLNDRRQQIPLEDVVEFLEMTRSRTSLKELRLSKIEPLNDQETVIERFASSLASGREIPLPFRLEKFSISAEFQPCIGLDTMDTSRLTDVRVGRAWIEPQQLTSLIQRATNLQHIELSFLHCSDDVDDDASFDGCAGPRLEDNKRLLSALASHGNLTALKFDCKCDDGNGCECLEDFELDFVQMLKAIGSRGKLRKLAMEQFFISACNIDMDDVCATIRAYIPYLQSLKLYVGGPSEGLVSNVISLVDLQELYFAPDCTDDDFHTPGAMTSAVEEIVPLPSLKRLALCTSPFFDDMTSRMCLAAATSLTDLRIGDADLIYTDFFKKWSDGFAPNLQVLMMAGLTKVSEEEANRHKHDNDHKEGLVRLLEKTARLRVLILNGFITDGVLTTIAKTCTQLEIFGLDMRVHDIDIGILLLQEIVDRCSKLKRFGGFNNVIRRALRLPKYRKLGDVDTTFWSYDFDSTEYE